MRLSTLLWIIAGGTLVFGIAVRSGQKMERARNERRVVDVLAQIPRYQEVFRGATILDVDEDGNGEYGFLQQIGGVVLVPGLGVNGTAAYWTPGRPGDVTTLATSAKEGAGIATWSGYRVQLVFHDRREGVREATPLPPPPPADATAMVRSREREYTVFAWPLVWNETGRHSFALDHKGRIWQKDGGPGWQDDRAPPALALDEQGWVLVQEAPLW